MGRRRRGGKQSTVCAAAAFGSPSDRSSTSAPTSAPVSAQQGIAGFFPFRGRTRSRTSKAVGDKSRGASVCAAVGALVRHSYLPPPPPSPPLSLIPPTLQSPVSPPLLPPVTMDNGDLKDGQSVQYAAINFPGSLSDKLDKPVLPVPPGTRKYQELAVRAPVSAAVLAKTAVLAVPGKDALHIYTYICKELMETKELKAQAPVSAVLATVFAESAVSAVPGYRSFAHVYKRTYK